MLLSRQFLFFLASLRSGEDPEGEVKEHRHARSAREIFGDFLLMVRLIQQPASLSGYDNRQNKKQTLTQSRLNCSVEITQ